MSSFLLIGIMIATSPVALAEYPQKGSTVTFVVPYSPGGNSDTNTRILAAGLEELFPGVSFVVLNKPGAGTQNGMLHVLSSKSDGYTLAHISSGGFFSSYLRPDRKAPYSLKNFIPIASHQIGKSGVFVRSDSQFKSLKSLIDNAKANPNKLKAGCASVLGSTHLGTLGLVKGTKAKFALVHLGSGSKQRAALLGGHVDLAVTGIDGMTSFLKSGDFRLLAVLNEEKSKFYPDVPTSIELGYDVTTRPMQGTAAPAGTPKEVIDILSKALGKVLSMEKYVKKFDAVGAEIYYHPADKYLEILKTEEKRMKQELEFAMKQMAK